MRVLTWLTSGLPGIIVQGILDALVWGGMWLFSFGVIEDPIFGAYFWEKYRLWLFAFVPAFIIGSALCLLSLWVVSLGLACVGLAALLWFSRESCVPFDECNLDAFLGYGAMIAFGIPALLGFGAWVAKKLAPRRPPGGEPKGPQREIRRQVPADMANHGAPSPATHEGAPSDNKGEKKPEDRESGTRGEK